MKISELVDYLSQNEWEDDAEILVEKDDGLLYDFRLEEVEETFDGFDTVYPAGLKICLEQ